MRPIYLGTRGSKLALTQSQWVADQCAQLGLTVSLRIIKTSGDAAPEQPVERFSGKGIFVAEIEQALLRGEVDLAVHSMKDLPGDDVTGLTIAATPLREDPRDVLIGRTAPTLDALPAGAVVGTSSLRRRAQILASRADLHMAEMRGNVDTRLRKLEAGQFDAICLAAAGMRRLGLAAHISEYFDIETVTPAVGQGALALQTRADDADLLAALAPLHDDATGLAVRAERQVLAAFGGGCEVPLGVYTTAHAGALTMTAVLCSLTGDQVVREHLQGTGTPEALGQQMADILLRHRARLYPETK